MKTYKVVTLTTVGNGTWTVPDDWNNDENEIHMIGGGGGGSGVTLAGYAYGGGGGGAYGYTKNYQATPGSGINYTVGDGGTLGYISAGTNGGNTIFGSLSVGGGNAPPLGSYQFFGAGGSYFSGSFTLTRNGGNGGQGTASFSIGGGGGGAGGFNGNGISGNTYSSGIYSCDGGSGDGGFGGSRGSQNSSRTPGIATISIGILSRLVGSGGGGAGSYDVTYPRSGNGGLYGGGGGGFGSSPGNPQDYATGAQGVIVIFWAVENYFPEAGYYCVTENLNRFFIKEHELIDQFVGEQLFLTGNNFFGQLGTNDTTDRISPVTTVAGGTNWKQISTNGTWSNAGYVQTAAIKTDGTLWTWGKNDLGQLGTNNTSSYSSPVTTVAGGTNWKQVSCGATGHTAAIKTDGTLWTWGYNFYGALGDNTGGTFTDKSSPITTAAGGTNWKSVSCGATHTAAIKTDGTLWTWGQNALGALGTNNTNSYSSPVTTVAGGTNWKQVSCGNSFTAAIKTDGTLWTWGYNFYGQLGTGTTASSLYSPVTTAGGGTNWKQVSGGYQHTAAIKTDGTLWVWGNNDKGQLGTNDGVTSKLSPVSTAAATMDWKSVSCGLQCTAAIGD